MSKLIPGNHKHLTLDDRIFIEKELEIFSRVVNFSFFRHNLSAYIKIKPIPTQIE